MQIVVLLALAATLIAAPYRLIPAPAWASPCAAVVYILMAGALARAARKAAMSDTPGAYSRRRAVLTSLTQLWLVLGSTLVMAVGYGWIVARWLDGWSMPAQPILDRLLVPARIIVDRILVLTPFILALLTVWTQEYPAYLHLRRQLAQRSQAAAQTEAPSLPRYLAYNARHQLLFILVPAVLIMLAEGLLTTGLPAWLGKGPRTDLVILFSMLIVAGIIFMLAPWLIVHIWRTFPLPAGPLRDQLEQISSRMGLRYRHILVWQTGGMIINAGVMGLVAPLRYVLLTDAMLEQMTPVEVQAVFAHEAGHVVSHHILYSGIFAAGTLLLSICGGQWLSDLTHWPDEAVQLAILAPLLVLWWAGFGYISRRFERQSDVIAAWVMGQIGILQEQPPTARPGQISTVGAAAFAQSLQRVAELNGMSHSRPNWRHGSIAWRVQYILGLGSSFGTRGDIDRLVKWIKAACWILLLASAAAVAAQSL